MDDVLRADGLVKQFGSLRAVDGVSLRVAAGETYGLLGPNGAGKTTTISMIAGLLRPDSGTVTVAGQELTPSSVTAKASLGIVPQELAIYPDLSGRENLRFFGRLYGMRAKALSSRIEEVLRIVGLADRAGDACKDYSGGMKRRLNIAVGLLHRPQLLILDEPTVGVDPQSRNAILENVEALSAEGMAVLYTTHYMEEAERLCDRVGIIDEGRLRGEGTRRDLVAGIGEQDRIEIACRGNLAAAAAAVQSGLAISGVSPTENGLSVMAANASVVLPEVLAKITAAGAQIDGVQVHEPNLEAVFLHLTGKALRD